MFLASGLQQLFISRFAIGLARWVLAGFGVLLVAAAISFVEPEETFAGIWALFHGVGSFIKAFQIRRVAKLLEEAL